ncbi:hypothetical protein QTN25_009893 [Entamoeba marina]
MLSIDSYNTPCLINGTSQTTDVKITDDSLDIINIDKGFITAHMRYKVRLNCAYSYLAPTDNARIENFYKLFIGLKSGTQIPGMYTTWENANNFSQDVCGCYVNAIDLLNTDVWIEFDVVMQYDDFLHYLT